MNESHIIPSPWKAVKKLVNKHWLLSFICKLLLLICCCLQRLLNGIWSFLCRKNVLIERINAFFHQLSPHYMPIINFFKAFLINPRATGSVIPSSRFLTRKMVSYTLACQPSDLIIDLGAGTGVVTQKLLASGIQPQQIIAVEYAANLASKLQAKFPSVKVIQGNAIELQDLLAAYPNVKHIISSLPLRSLPNEMSQAILAQIEQVLPQGGKYIQFTYKLQQDRSYRPKALDLTTSVIVCRNIPPARVNVWSHPEC